MAGRKRIEIDKVQFEKLCALQCKEEEIADFFECSVYTIERWCEREYKKKFREVFREKKAPGKIALRRTQFRLAEKSATMAIFLGKNILGQEENPLPDDPEALNRAREILGGVDSVID